MFELDSISEPKKIDFKRFPIIGFSYKIVKWSKMSEKN
ncbi:UNVERIFIED_ORG: hypothetical protein ABIC97_000789 [Peribacillus simplex]